MRMKRLRALVLLLAIFNPFEVNAGTMLRMLGAGGGVGGGGGGGGCSNSLNFSQSCNSQYLGVGGL